VPALQTTKKLNGAWSYHAYSLEYTTDSEVEAWYSLRYRLFYDFLREKHPDLAHLPLILTEGGIDRAGNAEKDGWQARGDESRFQRWLQWFDNQLQRDDYVVGVTLFQLGDSAGWRSFDLEPVATWLAKHLRE